MNLSVYGHTYTSVFVYTIDGQYKEQSMPGGVRLITPMINEFKSAIFGQGNNDTSFYEAENNDEFIKYYYSMCSEERDSAGAYYKVDKQLGYVSGKSKDNIYHEKPKDPNAPMDLIVWDEGLGGLELPENVGTVLWASNKTLPEKLMLETIADKCFLFLDADVLRAKGALISRCISWERTVTELISQIISNPKISYLLSASQILISFMEDGAVHLIKDKDGNFEAYLMLTHGGSEGELREKYDSGKSAGFTAMTAILGLYYKNLLDGKITSESIRIILDVAEGFVSYNGFYVHEDATAEGKNNNDMMMRHEVNVTSKNWPVFPIPLVKSEKDSGYHVPEDWVIINGVENDSHKLRQVAFDYVRQGAQVIEGLPQLTFGYLTSIERWGIEAYQNIRNLIVNYAGSDAVRPLSIGVFGTPGSGKSFGVVQIAENVLPGKIKKLDFNVSQFTSLNDMAAAFQMVRDGVLEGKLPLVFFDEFDSSLDGTALAWLKSFLMPMQDGLYKGADGTHPIGKCILVFAGGTAASIEEFGRPMDSDDPDIRQGFKNAKGPDFLSRLRGSIDIVGPNPKDETDSTYVLRRALLLRSLCERKLKMEANIAPISSGIIEGMLNVPRYKHGARSMEAIMDMSRIENGVFDLVSLPFQSQLELHVDAEEFIKLVIK